MFGIRAAALARLALPTLAAQWIVLKMVGRR
jgi:hypothetical protein